MSKFCTVLVFALINLVYFLVTSKYWETDIYIFFFKVTDTRKQRKKETGDYFSYKIEKKDTRYYFFTLQKYKKRKRR